MDLPPLSKSTLATVELVPHFGMDGENLVIVIIKQLFGVDRRDRVTRISGAEIRFTDQPWDETKPETSSTKFPSDICVHKPGTDVLVVGSAMNAYRERSPFVDVSVEVGPVRKTLRVFGERTWEKGLMGWSLSPPRPVEAVPLQWELAYGGSDLSDPSKPREEPRNPVGRGFVREASQLQNQPAPQIEDDRDLIGSHRSRPAPAGVAPIGRHWEPRRSFVGTMDEQWMRERMPLLPGDYDPRANQCATPEMIVPGFLKGGESVAMVGLSDNGPMRFVLPRMVFFVGAYSDDRMREVPNVLDTLVLRPNDAMFEMTWRASIRVPRPVHRLRNIQVNEKVLL